MGKHSKAYSEAKTEEDRAAVLAAFNKDVEGSAKKMDEKAKEKKGLGALVIVLIVLGVLLLLVAGFFFYRSYAAKSPGSVEARDTNVTGGSAFGASDIANMV